MKMINSFIRFLKKSPFFSRLDWQLYLIRDFWSSKVWKRKNVSETPFGFNLTSRWHPAYELMSSGAFEPEETKIVCGLFDNVDVFVDVGANLGYYTCIALQHGKKVMAFEPQSQNLSCLYDNLAANGWSDKAEVFPVAVSASVGLLPLFGASGPSASLVSRWAGYSPRFKQVVPTNTLNNVIAGRFNDLQLMIKIDVEGAEFQVLQGATQVMSRTPRPVWLVEVCFREHHPEGENPNFQKIFDLFWALGYACYATDPQRTPVDSEDVNRWLVSGRRNVKTFNYLFMDRAKSDWL